MRTLVLIVPMKHFEAVIHRFERRPFVGKTLDQVSSLETLICDFMFR